MKKDIKWKRKHNYYHSLEVIKGFTINVVPLNDSYTIQYSKPLKIKDFVSALKIAEGIAENLHKYIDELSGLKQQITERRNSD